ncbi:MAG TPA: enolase C-terminal domain-like protein [Armatimonadota bacterium]|nr:enolase C-terminal domain-like protein [Armatimonadota bacterium]
MRVIRISSFAIEVPIRQELMITSSLGTHSVSQPVLVRLETESGVIGAGEATVTPRWSGETPWGARAVIDHCLAPAVLGLRVDNIGGALDAMEAATVGNPFAKAAIETAMLDAWGKAAGKPVYELLGGPVRNRALPIRFSLAAARPEVAAENARRRVEWGHRTIKLKVGLNPQADLERVAAVREAIGPDIHLTVDANGGWSVEDAVWALERMRPYNLLLAEQPVRREDLDGMAEVRRRVDVPVMADESVFTLWDAEQALKKKACDVLSIYPGKNGGLTVSMQIAELAAKHGVSCAIGSNLELDPGTAAMCHLAVAAPNVDAKKWHGDILGTLYQEISIAKNPVRLEAGFAHCPTGPGFGVEVDWDLVERLQIGG